MAIAPNRHGSGPNSTRRPPENPASTVLPKSHLPASIKFKLSRRKPNTAVTTQLLAGGPNPARPDGFDWTPVLRTNVYRMTRDGAESQLPPTAISRASALDWRLRIDTKGGGFGTGKPRLRVGWPERTLTLAARGSEPYALAALKPHFLADNQRLMNRLTKLLPIALLTLSANTTFAELPTSVDAVDPRIDLQ
ncbi:MAG: DUF3999 family protein, partial [Thiotrichales bacterium]